MPPVSVIKCEHCGLAFPGGWGNYCYAVDSNGKRVVCPHPGEARKARDVTGMEWSEALAAARIGYASPCMCFECSEQFNLDLDRDEKKCPKCGSLKVRSANGAVGSKCPKCKIGVFRKHDTGIITKRKRPEAAREGRLWGEKNAGEKGQNGFRLATGREGVAERRPVSSSRYTEGNRQERSAAKRRDFPQPTGNALGN
jgi:hypothetical protein